MSGRVIRLPIGFRVDSKGKVVRCAKHLSVSQLLQQRSSKRVRVVKGKTTSVTKSSLISN
jgi:hypothetical protein